MTKKIQPKWLTARNEKAVKNKSNVRRTHGSHSVQYRICKAETKKLIHLDKLNQLHEECDELSKLPHERPFFKAIKKLERKPKTIGWGFIKLDGTLIIDKDEILETWASFFETLYNDPSEKSDVMIDCQSKQALPMIYKSKISNNIMKMKYE